MNRFNQSGKQLSDTYSLNSSSSSSLDQPLSESEEQTKDLTNLRQTIYNRSSLVKQYLQNRQTQKLNYKNQSDIHSNIQANKSNISVNDKQSTLQQFLQDKDVSLADVGRVYEKTNYGKWMTNIQKDDIYIDPLKKKKNSQVLKEQQSDNLIYNRAIRSQSSVSEYYNRKLSCMNDQLKVMKEKILKEQIQNYSTQIHAKGNINSLKQMSQQNKIEIKDYQDEIMNRCNRVDSYFNYKKNHNFLPKRSTKSFSFTTQKDSKQNKKPNSLEKKNVDTEQSQHDISTINATSILINQPQLMEEKSIQRESVNKEYQGESQQIDNFPSFNSKELQCFSQKNNSQSPLNQDLTDINKSILVQLIKRQNQPYLNSNFKKNKEQKVQTQKEKYLDVDFLLSPIKENVSNAQTDNRTKFPYLKNERSLPEKKLVQGLNKGLGQNQNQKLQKKELSISPPPSIGLNSTFAPASPSLRSVSDKKGNRLAQQIERKINRIKKVQRMIQLQVNENSPFQFGQSVFNLQEQEKQSVFQSSLLNNGVFSSSNKARFSKQQMVGRISFQDFTIGTFNQQNQSRNLIKEEDDEKRETYFLGFKNSESKRGSVNLLQTSTSQEKLKNINSNTNQKKLKSQCSINLHEDLPKQKETVNIQSQFEIKDQVNEIQLIRRDPLEKHKTGNTTQQTQHSLSQNITKTSPSNSPQNRIRLNPEVSPSQKNNKQLQYSNQRIIQNTLNLSDFLNKSFQSRHKSVSNNNFNSPMQQNQILQEESHKLKEQLPDITNQLIKAIEEEYGKKESTDILYLFYSQLLQVIQIEINDIDQNLKFKWEKQISERKKMLCQKQTVIKGMQNLILSCCHVDEEIKNENKQIHEMKKKEIGQIKNIDFYYEILQQHDFPDEEIGKVILQMKQVEQIRDNANANQFVKDYRFNTVKDQMDSSKILMQADRQDRAKRVKEFNHQKRLRHIQKLQ
ncbi:hypothetical protein ABPG72_019184 [Tetrahymena utriculariae]